MVKNHTLAFFDGCALLLKWHFKMVHFQFSILIVQMLLLVYQ